MFPTWHRSDVRVMWFDVINTRNINEELWFLVIFYQIKKLWNIPRIFTKKPQLYYADKQKKSCLRDEHFIFLFIKDTIVCHTVDSSFSWGTNVCCFRGIPLRMNLHTSKPIHYHLLNIHYNYSEYTTIEITSPWSRKMLASHKHWPPRIEVKEVKAIMPMGKF